MASYLDDVSLTPAPRVNGARRDLMKIAGITAAASVLATAGATSFAATSSAWDKTFPKNGNVVQQKVNFTNRLGINLVGDLYMPKSLDRLKKSPAIIVGHPFGGIKEQTSGLYAQELAARGFITLAFDASYQGESGPAKPHFIPSPEAYVEDFSAAVDYLGVHSHVDRNRIGVIGICGSGGWVLSAAQIDPRMKAIATVSMYDIGQAQRQGLNQEPDRASEKQRLQAAAEQRWADFASGSTTYGNGIVDKLTADTDPVSREFYEYYRTPRGQHPRGTNALAISSTGALFQFDALTHIEAIAPRPILFVMGDTAHSRIFSEQA
jgi:fermentation-respiration switch protein FrsA (DUF1100 family)